MKYVRGTFKILLSLVGVLILVALVILWVDSSRTSYLDIEEDNPDHAGTFLITNAHVIPMTADTVLRNRMVYIEDGIIKDIADSISAGDIRVVDAGGAYLLPGLIDMHVHVWDRYELGLYLANGVTAVRNVWGMPMHLRMKEDIERNEILAPEFYTTGPKLTGPEFIGDDNLNLHDPDEAKAKVASYKERGYDLIKTYYGLPEELFDAIIEQARTLEVDIVAHPSQKVPYAYHLDPSIKSIEHAEDVVQQPLNYQLDSLELKEVVRKMAASPHSRFCPTLTVYNNIYQMLVNDAILELEQLGYMNPLIRKVDSKAQFDRWQNAKRDDPATVSRIKAQHDFHLEIVRQLHQAGVPIICGTDAGIGVTLPGFSIHRELAFYKEAGLSNYEVLCTATVNAAGTHRIMNHMGTVQKGKVANLLLVEHNPLEDLSTLKDPLLVFAQGKKLDPARLQVFKENARDRKNLLASGLRYAENLIVEK